MNTGYFYLFKFRGGPTFGWLKIKICNTNGIEISICLPS